MQIKIYIPMDKALTANLRGLSLHGWLNATATEQLLQEHPEYTLGDVTAIELCAPAPCGFTLLLTVPYPVAALNRWAVFSHNANDDPIYRESAGSDSRWLTFYTRRDAELQVIEDLEAQIEEYRNDERTLDEIDVEWLVQPVTVYPDGTITTEFETYPPPTCPAP